ncbi:MAG: menaquinone biosynthesis protein [Desulfuromonadales bacterium]
MLRIGRIEYANCTPLYHQLMELFPCDGYDFIAGVPAELNRKLAAGTIDVCPSSSIEYALHPDDYLILPDISISSCGAVGSVLLFSRFPIEKLNGSNILLSSESATSVNLLKILMSQLYGASCSYTVTRNSFTEVSFDADNPALLLIGDAALRAALSGTDMYMYDLGTLWFDWTGLPFVFALWLCRRDAACNEDLKTLGRQLIASRESATRSYGRIADCSLESDWMGRERLLSYWRHNISYELAPPELYGLKLFYKKCHMSGLIASVPSLQFTEH